MAVTIQTEPTLAAGAGPALNVIQGWARELQRLVPVY
jgi:hypothetical protein